MFYPQRFRETCTRGQVIAAEGEHKASRALRHAADVIADSPAALQVEYVNICHHCVISESVNPSSAISKL